MTFFRTCQMKVSKYKPNLARKTHEKPTFTDLFVFGVSFPPDVVAVVADPERDEGDAPPSAFVDTDGVDSVTIGVSFSMAASIRFSTSVRRCLAFCINGATHNTKKDRIIYCSCWSRINREAGKINNLQMIAFDGF